MLYFENDRCVACGHKAGFDPEGLRLVTLTGGHGGVWTDLSEPSKRYRLCANAAYGVCNWLVPAETDQSYCLSCARNHVIPNLSLPGNVQRWQQLEVAKRRLLYSLLRLRLPLRIGNSELQFEFLSSELTSEPVVTGHSNGLVTINIEEADEIQRRITQLQMGEKYRTVLGHFRHEVGHFYWYRLVQHTMYGPHFRHLFGDERAEYAASLNDYYENGATEGWQEHYISAYATAHPWEDWAETWANYLHVMDSLETAWAFGMGIHPHVNNHPAYQVDIRKDPYEMADFQEMIRLWLPLTTAFNHLNRSMGHPDFYAFYISPMVMEKLAFVHRVCRGE